MAGRMSSGERARIEAHRSAGTGVAGIAVLVGGDRSTVCRELERGSCADGSCCAGEAQARADLRARRPKTPKLGGDLGLAAAVRYRLEHRWAQHSISADLAAEGRRVCAETIYRAAYSGCGLGDDAWRDLPRQRRRRKPRSRHAQKLGPLGDYRPISERRAAVEDRSEPGRWEGDLIVGQANAGGAATLAERTSRHALAVPLPDGYRAPQVAEAVTAALGRQPAGLPRTPHLGPRTRTGPPGRHRSRARHRRLSLRPPQPLATWIQRPDQRPAAPRWLPKGTPLDISPLHQSVIEDNLNHMPRRLHNWTSAAHTLSCV